MKSFTDREKLLLKILLVCVILTLVYYLIVIPLIKLAGGSDDELRKNRNNLEKLENIYREYQNIKQKKSAYITILNRKNENTTSLIEQWANSTGIAKNIAYTRSTQSNIQNKYIRISTDIKIESVPIQQFLKFLYEVEYSDNLIKVSYLRIHPALKGSNTYDINLKIDNFTSQ